VRPGLQCKKLKLGEQIGRVKFRSTDEKLIFDPTNKKQITTHRLHKEIRNERHAMVVAT
jgi:hypothetical protein